MLGAAIQTATRMGYHRDPSHYPLGQWVCELRRRAWNQLCCLDALAVNSYGVESSLPHQADTSPPMNAEDISWHASRYATSNTVPSPVDGLTGMTFALVQSRIADLTHRLSSVDSQDLKARMSLIQEMEDDLRERYLQHVDRSNPSHTIVVAFCEDKVAGLRLIGLHRETANHQCTNSKPV